MLCVVLFNAIFHDSFKFADPETSFCLTNYTYNWFNSTDYVSIKQLQTAKRIQTECPVIQGYGNCTCTPEQMITLVWFT